MAKEQALPLDLPEYVPDFSFEDRHGGIVCGIDEAGRGPLAGPVVASAVILRRSDFPADILAEINDSKKLTAEKREFLFKEINRFAHVGVGICTVEEIDRINILQASLLAMRKAHAKLRKLCLDARPTAALIDGNMPPKLGRGITVTTIIQGDARSFSIAAASIIAKHHRDQIMKKHAKKFPHYGWHTNVGYSTAEHLEALEKHGVTPLHRRSFAPVLDRLLKQSSANS
ncbi:MAG TPA: ribonuclease HII [Patescibacteria group bacterium]|nr:ribonuclease HII [Patescibacteria group bacterium]